MEMNKETIYKILLVITILSIILTISGVVLRYMGFHGSGFFYFNLFSATTKVLSIVFWIWNFILWSKYDQELLSLLGFIFLMTVYSIFYSRKVFENGWLIDKEKNDL